MKVRALILLPMLLLLSGCGWWKENMGSQPKDKPMQQSDFFADSASVRPRVPGTIARGELTNDSVLEYGFYAGKPSENFPQHYPTDADGAFPARGPELAAVLRHGADLYAVNCIMCHGDGGDGRGIVVERGFAVPPSYQIDRLRTAPVGHLFDVITNGYGQMYSFGDRIDPADRWAIVAYIRTLEMSQASQASQLPDAQRAELQSEAK